MSTVHQHQQKQQQQQQPNNVKIVDDKDNLITQQYAKIEKLQQELVEIMSERDSLLCEVSKFKFETEMADLKKLQDDK